MKAAASTLLGCVLTLIAQVALAQGTASTARQDQRLYLKIFEFRLLGAGQVVDCLEASTECNVDINIIQVPTPSGDLYCLAQLAETLIVRGTTNSGPAKNKKIVWSLKLDAGIDATKFKFKFQDKYGILVVDNPHSQLHSFMIGHGGSAPDNAMYFHMKNKRNKKPNEAIYLPVILQTETKSSVEVVSLCGAADPKIVND